MNEESKPRLDIAATTFMMKLILKSNFSSELDIDKVAANNDMKSKASKEDWILIDNDCVKKEPEYLQAMAKLNELRMTIDHICAAL